MKIFSITFSLILLIVALFMATNQTRIQNTFYNAWKTDIILIDKAPKMPAIWKSVSSVEVSENSHPLYLPIVQQRGTPVLPTENGKHLLEVLIVDATDGPNVRVIVQYDMVNGQKNTVFEFGRTLNLGTYIGGLFWPHTFGDQFVIGSQP